MSKAALDKITDKVLAHGATAKRRSRGRRAAGGPSNTPKTARTRNKGRNSR